MLLKFHKWTLELYQSVVVVVVVVLLMMKMIDSFLIIELCERMEAGVLCSDVIPKDNFKYL